MATPEEVAQLRDLLGEAIPEGGTEADTLFTDEKLGLLLDNSPGLQRAALEGWRIKAAHFANLVNVTDGNASREMSDLLTNAEKMVRMWQRTPAGPTEGRTRIGRVVRQ